MPYDDTLCEMMEQLPRGAIQISGSLAKLYIYLYGLALVAYRIGITPTALGAMEAITDRSTRTAVVRPARGFEKEGIPPNPDHRDSGLPFAEAGRPTATIHVLAAV